MQWQLLSTGEHAARRFASALLPLGTIEAHGQEGPVGTDNLIPAALCHRLSEELEIPHLPVMPYGVTSSLLAYPGSCSLTPEILEGFLFTLGRSLHRGGLRYLFVINGHGGNTGTLQQAAARLFSEVGLCVAVIDWWWEVRTAAEETFGKGGMGHSAVDEMGALAGLCPAEAENVLRCGRVRSFYNPKGVRAYPAPRAVLTYDHPDDAVDLSRLTPEKCARFADQVTRTLAGIIREILDGWGDIGAPARSER